MKTDRSRPAAFLCLFVLALVGCSHRTETRKHIVVVLIDELRRDCAKRWLTEVNALAERGIVVDDMRSVAPWTYPSVISLMSGLYPQQHHADGHLFENILTTFAEDLPLLPKMLQRDGYHTTGFVTNPFLHTFNPFHEGFDHYDIGFINSQDNRQGLGAWVWTGNMFANTVNPAVFRYWSERPVDGPEFTYVHYIDVHGPYDEAPFPKDYESATRYIDGRVVELYEFFRARYDDQMLFFVTSDHGRALDDDTTIGDGDAYRVNKRSVHDFNLQIPFYVLPSAYVTEPRHVSTPCSNIDFVPTLLDWLGVSPPPSLPGLSLLPLVRGTATELPDRPLYARNSAFLYFGDCMVLDGRKYMRHYAPRSKQVVARRVFDLESDPREAHSVNDTFGSVGEVLLDVSGTHGVEYPAEFDRTDPELLRKLQAIGYLGGEDEDR